MSRCNACAADLRDKPRVRVVFENLPTRKLNGSGFWLCPGCLHMGNERDIDLPERLSDPEAEPLLVNVDLEHGLGWTATCIEHGRVAQKEDRPDAELAAAIHLSRLHVGMVA